MPYVVRQTGRSRKWHRKSALALEDHGLFAKVFETSREAREYRDTLPDGQGWQVDHLRVVPESLRDWLPPIPGWR